MATLATVALSCANQLGRVNAAGTAITDLENEIKEQIAETVRFYNRKPYALTEFHEATFKTAAGVTWTHTVGLTSGFGDQDDTRTGVDANTILYIQYARLEPVAGAKQPLRLIDMTRFETLHEGSSTSGTPTYLTLYGGAIGLWPTPTITGDTVFLNLHIKPAVPTADADESVWFREAGEMIEAGALARVCIKYLRDRARAQEFGVVEQNAADALHREFVRKGSSGKIRPHA